MLEILTLACRAVASAKAGGGSRIRTGDILLAKQTLYQLSYTPGKEFESPLVPCRSDDLYSLASLSPKLPNGGPDKNRTCDLVLIRDAL